MPRQKAGRHKGEELFNGFHALSLSTVEFYHCLTKARRQFHDKELADPKWNVMTILEHAGPQTVPQIARSRKLSRQSIQNTVNLLHQEGYAEFIENPAHKKSSLVRLTDRGEALADEMNRREKELVSKIRIDIKPEEMLKAAQVMQSLKSFFESSQWKLLLEESTHVSSKGRKHD